MGSCHLTDFVGTKTKASGYDAELTGDLRSDLVLRRASALDELLCNDTNHAVGKGLCGSLDGHCEFDGYDSHNNESSIDALRNCVAPLRYART